jgi:hypothetical protein
MELIGEAAPVEAPTLLERVKRRKHTVVLAGSAEAHEVEPRRV